LFSIEQIIPAILRLSLFVLSENTGRNLSNQQRNSQHCEELIAVEDIPDRHSKDLYNESLGDIFNNINIGIAYVDLGGEVLTISRALAKMLGIAEAELIGKNIVSIARQLLSPKDKTRVAPILLNLIKGNEIAPFEFNYRGKVLELSASINHESKRLIGVIQDVTERKKAEAALRHSEELFRVLVNTVGEGIIFQNAEGKIIHWNKTAEKYLALLLKRLPERVVLRSTGIRFMKMDLRFPLKNILPCKH
jgi:PAS domain S-box-containing protein